MGIPFIDLKAQMEKIGPDVRTAIDAVLAHGQFIMGPEVERLEQELVRYVGAEHAVACGSGTDALLMALMARGIGPGDAVFTPPFTFVATAEVVALLGATPVFVDIDEEGLNLDPALLEEAVRKVRQAGDLNPRAVIPVDLFGLPADYRELMAVAERHGLFVLEDAAQSFGGRYFGRVCGALGHIGATSFFPAKPLGCYGDGGAIFTRDAAEAEVLRSIRVHGQGRNKYDNVRIGLNGRLDTIQAAVLLVKLEVFPEELEARQRAASRYTTGLAGLVRTPATPEDRLCAWAQYSVRSPNRESIQGALQDAGIPSAIYYPKPLHLQEAFRNLGYGPGDFPVSESAAREIFSLPMHPYLTDDTVDRIVETIRGAV